MSHRLSQLLGDFQSKLGAATKSHGAPASYGGHFNGNQVPYGQHNPYPAGTGPSNSYTPYGGPHQQAAPAQYDRPSGDSPPPYGSHSQQATPYGPMNPHAAPAVYGPPSHPLAPYGTASQYGPPAPAGSSHPPYGQPAQHPPPTSYGHNPTGPLAYGPTNSHPTQCQQHPSHAPSASPASIPSRVSIRSAGFSSDSMTIHAADSPSAPALYAFRTGKSKPHITMLHPKSNTELGSATMSTMGSGVQLSLRGQTMKMKQNTMGDRFTVESARGTLKWKVDGLSGKLSKCVDGEGRTVARYKEGSMGLGEKSVEVCVAGDQGMFELVLLSLMAAKALIKTNNKVVSEVVQAVAGV